MIELVLVHRREEELDFIREHLIELQNNNIDVMFLAEYNINSSKFLERRTANSLMSRHATLKSPFMIFLAWLLILSSVNFLIRSYSNGKIVLCSLKPSGKRIS